MGAPRLASDCSGLTQLVYKLAGIQIPRDSRDQAKTGVEVSTLAEANPGDLAYFFENTSHVGIILADGIVHCAGSVRIDDLDETGIRNRDSGEHTHKLTTIRRYLV